MPMTGFDIQYALDWQKLEDLLQSVEFDKME